MYLPITTCITTYNNLNYLKLAVYSVRKYSYFTDMRLIVHAENCDDGTDEWLEENSEKYNIDYYIDKNETPIGIGGGMNFCADKVEEGYINFMHSDFFVSPNWDLELFKVFEDNTPGEKLWVNSHRVEPDLWGSKSRPGTVIVPKDYFGYLHDDFDEELWVEWSQEFRKMNNFQIPKGEGVSGMILKEHWDAVGGNDDRFAPAWWEDFDLFLRMKEYGIQFVLPSSSIIFHFGARSSHFAGDDFTRESSRAHELEPRGARKFYEKWGGMPVFDEYGMISGVK